MSLFSTVNKNDDTASGKSTLAQDDDVSVRIHDNANANCWGADFPPDATIKNDARIFKAKIP